MLKTECSHAKSHFWIDPCVRLFFLSGQIESRIRSHPGNNENVFHERRSSQRRRGKNFSFLLYVIIFFNINLGTPAYIGVLMRVGWNGRDLRRTGSAFGMSPTGGELAVGESYIPRSRPT